MREGRDLDKLDIGVGSVMRATIVLALSVALAVLAVACNGGGEALRTATPEATPSATATPQATPTPTAVEYPPKVSLTEGGVYLMRPDGTGLRHLTPGEEGLYSSHWSPDGSRIAVLTSACYAPRVSVIDADSGDAVEVAAFDGSGGGQRWIVWGVQWSPDGRQLVVPARRYEEGEPYHTFLVNADGSSEPIELFEGFAFGWSPDGESLAFFTRSDEGATLSIFDMATYTATVIDKGKRFTFFRWSPDGQRIAYSMYSTDATYEQVVVMDRDGGNRRVVPERSSHPEWSPDGEYVAFSVKEMAGGWSLAVAPADGSEEYARLALGQVFRWSPKGDAILVSNVGPHLRLVSLATHEAHDLADDIRPVQPWGGMSFSPDGEQLTFIGSDPYPQEEAHNALYVMNIDGTGVQKLVRPSRAIGSGVDWSPDGRYIAFVDTIIGGCE
jgi:Tol biopolymer transport system component